MSCRSFFNVFAILLVTIVVIVGFMAPLVYSQIREVVFNLNLHKNREQAERLATLVSIDLEEGEASEQVLAKVQSMLENTPQSSEHFACIIEDENKVIAHPKPSNVNKDVTGWRIHNEFEEKTFTQAAGEGVAFGGIQTRLDGSQDISYQVPIRTKPWAVCVHTKLDIVDEQVSLILQRVAMVTLPGLLLIVLMGSFWISKEKKPTP